MDLGEATLDGPTWKLSIESKYTQKWLLFSWTDGCQLLRIKEEALHEWSSSVNQEDTELLHIKEEQQLWSVQQMEKADGLEEEITSYRLTIVYVKNEDGEEKHQSPQLQRLTEEDIVADPSTSSSVEQIKLESDVKKYETQEEARNPGPNTIGKMSESSGTEVSDDEVASYEDWQNPLSDSEAETEDSDSDCKRSRAPVSGENSYMKCKTVKTEVKQFACDVCGKRFTRHCYLKQHMRVHTGEKPFGCDVCGTRFAQHGSLKQHMRVHTGEKPFGCDVCGTRFAQHGNLKRHMRVHTSEKSFGCTVFGKD